jgi:pimeloyl-ACP methyl ester carboxylesterase
MFHVALTPGDRLEELLGTEALATLREVVLMPRDLGPVLPRCAPGDDVVVLVHGFMASAGVWRPMRARIEAETQAKVATFSHAPGASVKTIAKKLARLVDRIPRGARVHIVGHSLGGLVARWFVQELGGHARVAQTISLASPFGGTPVAERLRLFVGADLCPSSAVLQRIKKTAHVWKVPHTSIVASDDRMVGPPENAMFDPGDVVVMRGRGHNTLLYDEEVTRLVVDRVRRPQ